MSDPTYNTSDLRYFLAETDAAGLTLYVDKPVEVTTQVAALCSETTKPTLFRNLKNYEDFQLTDCLTRFRDTQAIAMGIERGKPELVMSSYLQMISKGPGPTVSIDDAPIKEVIWTGEDADLFRLPVPVPSEGVDFPHLNIKAEDFHVPTISGGMGVTKHQVHHNPSGASNHNMPPSEFFL